MHALYVLRYEHNLASYCSPSAEGALASGVRVVAMCGLVFAKEALKVRCTP